MRDYELIFIVHPDMDEANFVETVDRVKGWITGSGGSIIKEEKWGKRRMAYAIRKQREGQYMYLQVTMDPTYNSELDRQLRYLEPVMRFLLVSIES